MQELKKSFLKGNLFENNFTLFFFYLLPGSDALQQSQVEEVITYLKAHLAGKIFDVKTTSKLETHPCVITVQEMAAARHFIRTQAQSLSEENRFALLRPHLEINAKWVFLHYPFENENRFGDTTNNIIVLQLKNIGKYTKAKYCYFTLITYVYHHITLLFQAPDNQEAS